MQSLIKHMLNLKTLNGLRLAFTFIFVFVSAILVFSACGKRKPPLPPVERVAQRVVISGGQRGNKVSISWQMPARNAPDDNILNISRAEIYRLAEKIDSPLTLNEEEYASQSTLIATVQITDSDFARKTLTYTDTLELAGQPVRLRYAIRFVNDAGQKAAFSNYLLIEPSAGVANSPSAVKAEITEAALILKWEEPTENVDGSKPPNILGYNIYRSVGDGENFSLLNKTPITTTEFSDVFFAFDQRNRYFLRTISLGANGEPVESLDSPTVEATPRDTFAPGAPEAVTIAASPGNISIFFAANPEKDIAGYKIYRSENESLPKAEWKLLTPNLLTTNTFQDRTAESGKTYFYYVTAIDKAGNVSQNSEVVSETVP